MYNYLNFSLYLNYKRKYYIIPTYMNYNKKNNIQYLILTDLISLITYFCDEIQ